MATQMYCKCIVYLATQVPTTITLAATMHLFNLIILMVTKHANFAPLDNINYVCNAYE